MTDIQAKFNELKAAGKEVGSYVSMPRPSMKIEPVLAESSPLHIFNNVVLPAPEGPMSVVIFPL